MSSAVERLHTEVETVARSESPSLTFTTVSHEGLPHTATVWFAPTDELNLLTFSSPNRVHSKYIDICNEVGVPARVSGGIREEQQKKSKPVHGVTFEGTAERLTLPEDIESAIGRFLIYETFVEDEIDKYLNHPSSEVPAHGVYVIKPTLWTVMDGRLGSDNPERLVHLPWASDSII